MQKTKRKGMKLIVIQMMRLNQRMKLKWIQLPGILAQSEKMIMKMTRQKKVCKVF